MTDLIDREGVLRVLGDLRAEAEHERDRWLNSKHHDFWAKFASQWGTQANCYKKALDRIRAIPQADGGEDAANVLRLIAFDDWVLDERAARAFRKMAVQWAEKQP